MGFLRTSKFLAASMANQLTERFNRLVKTVRGEARLTESNLQDALREVRLALIEADVALPVVKAFIERVKAAALGAEVATSLTPGQAFVGVVHRELVALMSPPEGKAGALNAYKSTDNSRVILALSAIGRDATQVVGALPADDEAQAQKNACHTGKEPENWHRERTSEHQHDGTGGV